jgi:hypothetical protein
MNLQPLGLGDIFDDAFDLYKRNFALFVGIVAVIHVPTQLALGAALLSMRLEQFDRPGGSPTEQEMAQAFGVLGLLFLVIVAAMIAMVGQFGALAIAVSERRFGRPFSLGLAYRSVFRHIPRLMITTVIVGFVAGMAAFIALSAVSILSVMLLMGSTAVPGGGAQAVSTVIGVLAVLVMFLSMMAAFAGLGMYVIQIVTLEGGGYLSAISRNTSLVKGQFLRSAGALTMLMVVAQGLSLTIAGSVTFGLQLALFSWIPVTKMVTDLVELGVGALVSLFVTPYWMIVLTLLYYDRRVRMEGLDIAIDVAEMERRRAAALSPEVTEAPAT